MRHFLKHACDKGGANAGGRRKRRGYTLLEVVISSGLSVLAIGGACTLFVSGISTWMMGESKLDAENSAELGIRQISDQLSGAMAVTVDSNGLGVTYELPATDDTGNYLTPITWDGIDRRIYLQGTSLMEYDGVKTTTLVQGIILTDPLSPSGQGAYQIFTAAPGAVTYQVTMELVTQRNGVTSASYNATYDARDRETIYLRNVPHITR